MKSKLFGVTVATAVLCLAFAGSACVATAQTEPKSRPVVKSAADLPRHTYDVTGSLTALFSTPESFGAFVGQVVSDIRNDLDAYAIEDRTTLKGYHRAIADAALLAGQDAEALRHLDAIRELEDKPSARAMSGLIQRAVIAAEAEAPKESPGARRDALRRHLQGAVSGLEWSVIQEEIEALKGRMEIVSENFMLGMIQGRYQPVVDATGSLSGDLARDLIAWRVMIDRILPYRDECISVLAEVVSEHRVAKPDIWSARAIDLSAADHLTPVAIGIWDTGVDPSAFDPSMLIRSSEDPVATIAFTWKGERTAGPLLPLDSAMIDELPGLMQHFKGMLDVRASIDSPEAQAVKRLMAGMKPDEAAPFMEHMWLCVMRVHGTHIAGIALRSNPAARLVVVRQEFPYQTIPELILEDEARKQSANFQAGVEFLKSHGVRVVNMSWAFEPKGWERLLEVHGVEATPEERTKRARELFSIQKNGLVDAIQGAPEILFVVAAGNSDSDSDFDLRVPASIDARNVLTVGAVDQAGDAADFTSFGASVDLYANGWEVESVIPGGKSMALSGTSQAAPQVANLAAKLLAVDPSLSAESVAELIRSGADLSADGKMRLMNPKRTIELLKSRR